MAEQEQNRSEPATPFKLREAKKRGSVAKSQEINSVLVIGGFLAYLSLMGWPATRRQFGVDLAVLSDAHTLDFSPAKIVPWLSGMLVDMIFLLAPLFVTLIIVGIVASLIQTGPIFSLTPLKPDFNRLNPATGFKRLFSLRQLFDTAKTVVKLVAFTWVLYLAIRQLLPALMGLMYADPSGYGRVAIDDAAGVIFKLLLAMLAVALVDVMFGRWDYLNKLKMSRREVKDEIKQREGDPRIKSRIRELQNEMRKKSRALRNLPKADVLITNPTHLGVALRYKHGEMPAPIVVAKGAGELVEKMKQVARKHGIPIVANRTVARALFKTDFEAPVPDASFPEVAKILVWVFAMRDARNAAGSTQ